MMSKLDPYEREVLEAYESGKLRPTASKTQLQRLRAAARATAIKDRRVNIRLSSVDLLDIQAKALEEGMPYQTLIASVLHKYVTGRLAEREPSVAAERRRQTRSTGRPAAAG
jgi:predicted DNA binding CopG/RHH family protein